MNGWPNQFAGIGNTPADASVDPSGLNLMEEMDIVCPPMVYINR